MAHESFSFTVLDSPMGPEIYDPEALHGVQGAQQQCRAKRLFVHIYQKIPEARALFGPEDGARTSTRASDQQVSCSTHGPREGCVARGAGCAHALRAAGQRAAFVFETADRQLQLDTMTNPAMEKPA